MAPGRSRRVLTFSSVCTNCSTGMEPLSKGFRTLQSGMSSFTRFLFFPPVGGAGLGGGWSRRNTGQTHTCGHRRPSCLVPPVVSSLRAPGLPLEFSMPTSKCQLSTQRNSLAGRHLPLIKSRV